MSWEKLKRRTKSSPMALQPSETKQRNFRPASSANTDTCKASRSKKNFRYSHLRPTACLREDSSRREHLDSIPEGHEIQDGSEGNGQGGARFRVRGVERLPAAGKGGKR